MKYKEKKMAIHNTSVKLTPYLREPHTPTGIDIVEGICEVYNSEINKTGRIKHNNSTIWHILHACDDEIWRGIFESVLGSDDYRSVHWKTAELRTHLLKYANAYAPWCMTPYEGQVKKEGRPKSHSAKGKLWCWLFLVRDVYNSKNNIHCPNDDSSIGILNPEPYEQLFEEVR
tara:strand:- start:1044 stop:1562 length:519 start_codon:yes stop_codon:yes gene_type:complete